MRSAPRTVIVRLTARRTIRTGAIWGAGFGLYVTASASGYAATYPTVAARAKLAHSLAANSGIAALLGPARRLDTVAGFTAWRTMGILTIAGAIWGLLTATRMLRGEEDTGRWELLLAGETTLGDAAGQALAGLTAGLLTLWSMTAVFAVADGTSAKVNFSVTGALFLSTALVVGAATFLALGALLSQLASTRRQANMIGAGCLGLAFVVRMIADSGAGTGWMRWASPLGWAENMHPLTGSNPIAALPAIAFIAILVVAAVKVAGRRDVQAGALPSRSPHSHTRLLTGPLGLDVVLLRGVFVAWTLGLAMMGLVFGLVAQSAADAASGSATVERALARLGGHHGGAAAYLGVTFVFAAALVAYSGAGQMAAARAEEADGLLDHLVAQPVSRARWFVGRLTCAAILLLVEGAVAGAMAWVGAATQRTGVSLGLLLQAGVNIVPAAVFVLGVGALAYGVVPRWASPITFGLVTWSILLEVVASTIRINRWVIDTSVFHHVAPVPAANPNWVSAGALMLLGVAAAAGGAEALRRRDIVSA